MSRIVLITGTRSGIGRHLAEHYLAQGDTVVGCSRTPTDLVADGYTHHCLDVADEAPVLELFRDIRERHSRIDVLINNAGTSAIGFTLMTPLATVRNVIETNIVGTFLFSREAGKMMMAKRAGLIVNLSSIHVPLATPGSAIYGASKAFIEQFSRVLARELEAAGVSVRTLGLSIVESTGMKTQLKRDVVDRILEQTETKRCLELGEVAEAIDELIASTATGAGSSEPVYLGGVA